MVVDYLCFGKHGRREDNNFEGRVAMKSNLQLQVLHGKLVMLTFKSNTVLSTKICLEYWLRYQTLIRLYLCLLTSGVCDFSRHRACFFRAEVKSPRLIFISLKRRLFPLITALISSASELYRMGKTFIEKLLQNEIFKQ